MIMLRETIISHKGTKSHPDKIVTITQMPTRLNKAALLRLVSVVNLSPFCPNLSAMNQPLHVLTQDIVQFPWSTAQEKALNKAKQLISSTPVLGFYDSHKPRVSNARTEIGT